MTTPTNGDFNTNPYFDDFEANKNFMQVLFKPGQAVQARELTQSQTVILEQLKSMSSHLFTDGTPVINGKLTINKNQRWLLVNQIDMNVGLKNQIIIGLSSGAKAIVEHLHADYNNEPYLYIKEIGGTFFEGETIETVGFSSPELSITLQGSQTLTSIYESEFGGTSTFASNDDGIYAISGKFVPTYAQTIMVDKNSGKASSKVGFTIVKEIITAVVDNTLLDPAHGFYNYNAPGSDRYKITLTLSTRVDHDINTPTLDFIDLMTLFEGDISANIDRTYNAVLEETIARRTYDESGNYTTKIFPISLINNIPNEAIDPDKFVVKLDPGKAYVHGYEIESKGPLYLEDTKARTFERKNNGAHLHSIGPYVELAYDLDPENSSKTYNDKWAFDVSKQELVEFLDSSGTVLFDTRMKHIIDGRMYLCSSCDDFALMRSAKTVRSVAYPVDRVATLSLTDDIVILQGLDRISNPSILKLPESNIKTVMNNETHFSAHKTYHTVNVSSNTASFTTGSSQITISKIIQVVNDLTHYVIDPGTYNAGITGIGTNSVSIDFGSLSGSVNIITELSIGQSNHITKTLTINTESLSAVDGIITLSNFDVYDIISIEGSTSGDVKSKFRVNNGQLDHLYNYGSLTWNDANPIQSETFSIEYRYFAHGNSGEYFSVDSYTNSYDNTVTGFTDLPIPYENDELRYVNEAASSTYYLRDTLDFRANINSIENGKYMPIVDTLVYADYDYYIPRIDLVTISADGSFSVVNGVPDMNAVEPNLQGDTLLLYKLFIPAYTFTTSHIGIESMDTKRYTMRDIGKLEKRIDIEEYYTSLSLLEQQAIDMSILDANGLDRYKNGVLVDNFTGHGVGDVEHEEYNVSVDSTTGTLRMPFKQHMIDMEQAGENDSDVAWNGNTASLSFSSVSYIEQLQASQVMNVNPYNVFAWQGSMTLQPDTDNWVDTETNPDVLVNFDGNMDNWFTDDGWNSSWNSWQDNVTGVNLNTVSNSTSRNELVDVTWRDRRNDTITTTTDTTSLNVTTSSSRSGLRSRTIPETVTESLGNRVVDISIVPMMRGNVLHYKATGLKPNVSLHATFDGEQSDLHCTNLLSDVNGTCEGDFEFPSGVFRTGERLFRLTDSLSDPTTSAESAYVASGLLQTQERTVASVTSFRTEVESLFESGASSTTDADVVNTSSSVSRQTGRAFRWRDPLAQSFLVSNKDGGIFLTSLEIYFRSKDDAIPCLIEIREMVNGYPGQIILPYSTVSLNPDDITVTGNEYAPVNSTTFSFTDPVFLSNNTEYCFAIISDSDGYEVYTAKIGDGEVQADGIQGPRINKQPYMGVMFKSQNGSTWTADQNMDITFKMNRAAFLNDGVINFYNTGWDDQAADGSEHINITTMMPTIEEMSLGNSAITWELRFKEGSNELNLGWTPFTPFTNDDLQDLIELMGEPGASDPTQVHIRGTIETLNDNVSPIINTSRVGLIAVANTGTVAGKCTIAGQKAFDIGTDAECDSAGGLWETDETNFTIEGNYVTRSVELEDPAENINVWLTADKPQGTAVDLYYSTGGTIKRYIELQDGINTYTDGYSLVYVNDFEKQYVHFYTSDNIAFTVPDAGALYGSLSAYGTRAYANRDRDHGVANEKRLYLVNIDDVAQVQYGGWMSNEDLRDSVDWDTSDTYIEGDVIRHSSGNFYKCLISNTAIEPTVTSYWRDSWDKVILIRVQSGPASPVAKDRALISEDKVTWMPMEAVETSSFKQAQQAASTTGGEEVSSGFVEYEYSTADKIEDPFSVFRIKVVLKALNAARVPGVRSFRAVASL
jgi:hypothetical protein